MEIKLITGATIHEAAINCIKKIDVKNFNETNLVVVPDSFSLQAESLIFDCLKIKSTFNIEVVGISRLASKILRNHDVKYERIGGIEEVFTIYKAIKICENDFKYFKNFNVDFCLKILQIIKQFKACKITPEKIKKVGNDLLDRKMEDLKNIYQNYEMLLGEKLDLSKMLSFFIENAKNFDELSKINLFFVNFDSFSVEINSFICKLAQYVKSVNISIAKPISIGNSFIYEDDILQKTIALSKEYGVNVQVENSPTNLDANRKAIVENLFSFDIKPQRGDYFLNVVAKNRGDEIEFVAKYIKYRISKGARYKNFAVAVADKNYFEKVKNVFRSYGISSYCDAASDLSQTILGRFLLAVVRFAKLGMNKSTFEYFATHTLTKMENCDEILKKVYYYDIDDEDEFVELFPDYKNLISLVEGISKSKTTLQYVSILKNIVEIVQEQYAQLLNDLTERGLFKQESENAQAKELIEKVFDRLAELGKDECFEIVDFENLLTLAFNSVKVETIPSYVDAVYVGDVTESYFEDVETLFVLGATSSALPKTQSDIGIIDDDDIAKLRFNFALEPEIKVINRRNRLKLFEVLQHAQKRLVVCSVVSEDGQTKEKAGFVKDLIKIFGENVISTESLTDLKLGILSKADQLEKFKFYIGGKTDSLKNLSAIIAKNKLPKIFEISLRHKINEIINPFQNNQDTSVVSKILLGDAISASQLETYFQCPYKHFVGYGLRLKTKENIRPSKRLFGIFEHLLLKVFVEKNQNLRELTDLDVENFLKNDIKALAEQVYDKKVLNKNFVSYLAKASKIILKNLIFEQKNSEFLPIFVEKKIFKPFYKARNKNISLVGFVDRVDVAKNYFRVIDYKTGKTENLKKELYYGKKLQLFLYADSIKKELDKDCAGVYYFNCQIKYTKQNKRENLFNGVTLKDDEVVLMTDRRLNEEGFKSDILGMSRKKRSDDFSFKNGIAVDSIEKMCSYSKLISEKAVEEISCGYFETKPLKGECERCPYRTICAYKDKNGFRLTQNLKEKTVKEEK